MAGLVLLPETANAEYIEYKGLSGTYIRNISLYNDKNIGTNPPVAQWDIATHNLHFFLDNDTTLTNCVINVFHFINDTTSKVPGESLDILLVLTGPNGLYIEYSPTKFAVPFRTWMENETIYYVTFTFYMGYHIADTGNYDLRVYFFADHDDLVHDRITYYKLTWEVSPIYKIDNLFNDILPLIFVLVTSASVSIISGKPNMLFFLVAIGMSWSIMIFTTLLPFWSIIIPVLLLVVLIFIRSNGGDNDE